MPRIKEDPVAMAKRGSKRGKKQLADRKKAAAKRKRQPALPKPTARPIRGLQKLICSLPGYDPHLGAEAYRFDASLAKEAIGFFETELRHSKGPKARHVFDLEDWQRAVVANLYGWVHRETGHRRYETLFMGVPRKNGKTPFAAGLIVHEMWHGADAGQGAEIYGAASEYQQASLVFHHARGMVLQNDKLAGDCRVLSGQARSIQRGPETLYTTYRVVSAVADSFHGANASAVVVDELHAIKGTELLEAVQTSVAARESPLILYITTSDYAREGSVCNQLWDYSAKVRDGIIDDPTWLPVIYEAARDDDWTSEKVWAKANPNLGVSVKLEYMRSACQRAQVDPAFENSFKRLHLNIRTEQDTRWMNMDKWDACAGEVRKLEDYAGQSCWGGLDLASTRDMTAFVLCFKDGDDRYRLFRECWIPESTVLERSRRDGVPYDQWVRQGLLRVTPGASTDYASIRKDINEIVDKYKLQMNEIGLDRLFQGEQLGQELEDQDGLSVVAIGQGFAGMASPTRNFGELVRDGKIAHGGDPIFRWHASNVAVELDAHGNMRPSRKKSTEKIDSIVAAIMALSRALVGGQGGSIYEKQGLMIL